MPAPEGETPYPRILPEVGSAVYTLWWFWPVQTCASYGRAKPLDYQQVSFLMSRN